MKEKKELTDTSIKGSPTIQRPAAKVALGLKLESISDKWSLCKGARRVY